MSQSEERLAKQFAFLRKLKRLRPLKLKRLHRKTFSNTKYSVRIPKWMHRSILERRLFYYFCLKNYHYPKNHPIAVEFAERAKHVLSQDYVRSIDKEEDAKQQVKDASYFSAEAIRCMSINEVDRYLASLSLYVEASEDARRKVLWEWFHLPATQLPAHYNPKGELVKPRRNRQGKLNNKYSLRDLILKHPTLGYRDFIEAFGQDMPTVSMASFHNTRSLLRRAGYSILALKKGPSRPAVVVGPYGQLTKARMLNDTTTLGAKADGEEEPW